MSNAAKCTPGPWRTDFDVNGDPWVYGHDGHVVVRFGEVYGPIAPNAGEHEANANLMAAAPDLFDALDDVPLPSVASDATEFYGRFYDWYNGKRAAAIAKATGQGGAR